MTLRRIPKPTPKPKPRPPGRPPLPKDERRVRVYVRLHPDTVVALGRVQRAYDCSRTAAIEICIKQWEGEL